MKATKLRHVRTQGLRVVPRYLRSLLFGELINVFRSKFVAKVESFLEYVIQLIEFTKLPLCKGFVLPGSKGSRILMIFLIISIITKKVKPRSTGRSKGEGDT
jgi:hypothetical protein